MSSLYNRLERVIDRFENDIVLPKVKEIEFSFYVQVAYHILLIFLGVLSNLEPSTTSAIAAFGLGSLGFVKNFNSAKEDLEKYRKDRIALKIPVTVLRTELELCGKDDEVCLKGVHSLLKEYLEEAKR